MLCAVVAVALLGSCLGFHSVDPPKQDCVTRPLPYGPCSASCGGGVKTRQLQIVRPRIGYGRACPPLSESVSCNEQPCAVDCQVQAGEWSQCSATCGQGTQTKLDQILIEASNGGRPCPSEFQLRQTRSCQPQLPACPVPKDCVIGYTQYSQCTVPCGGGTQTRSAFIVSPAENGGAPCPADMSALTSTRPCNQDIPCSEPKDCEFISGDYGACSATCGQGVQTRHIYIVAQPEQGGRACPAQSQLKETRPCQAGPCPQPQDCLVQFPPFSQCSKSCGGGLQSTTGQVVRQATAGGAPCPSYGQMTVQRSCNNSPCVQLLPIDCEIEYGPYSECSAQCGGGFKTRKGYVKKEAENFGLQCAGEQNLVDRIPCNQQACPQPQDCVVQQGYWSKCQSTGACKPGIQTRQLSIVSQAAYGGLPCPRALVQTRECQLQQSPAEAAQCAPKVDAYGRPIAQPRPQPSVPQPQPQPRPFVSSRPSLNQQRPSFSRFQAARQVLQPAQPAPAAAHSVGQTFTFGGAYGQ